MGRDGPMGPGAERCAREPDAVAMPKRCSQLLIAVIGSTQPRFGIICQPTFRMTGLPQTFKNPDGGGTRTASETER